ncbi:MAG: hypothetical protein PHG25_00100 [Candidatus Pacebacteria bacterium]|nr:hypothetical protein [Candidatus Paceibacterota bacterium]
MKTEALTKSSTDGLNGLDMSMLTDLSQLTKPFNIDWFRRFEGPMHDFKTHIGHPLTQDTYVFTGGGNGETPSLVCKHFLAAVQMLTGTVEPERRICGLNMYHATKPMPMHFFEINRPGGSIISGEVIERDEIETLTGVFKKLSVMFDVDIEHVNVRRLNLDNLYFPRQ